LYSYFIVNEHFTIPSIANISIADVLKPKQKTPLPPAVTEVTFYTLPNYTGSSSVASTNTDQLTHTPSGIGSIALPDGYIVKLTNTQGKTIYIYMSSPNMPEGFTGSCTYIIYSKQVLFFTEPKHSGTTIVANFGSSGQTPPVLGSVAIPNKYTVTLTPNKIETTPATEKPIVLTHSVQTMPKDFSNGTTYTYTITTS
jgi:hypothetical protein